MDTLIEKNLDFFNNLKLEKKYNIYPKKIIEKLNEHKLIIISGLKGIGKTNLISYTIQKTNYKNNFFYFNKKLDLDNQIKSGEMLFELIKSKKNLKLIILENIVNIKNIKESLAKLYKSNYKVIIIGNNIKIGNKPHIEIRENELEDNIILNIGRSQILQKYNLGQVNLIKKIEKLAFKDIIFEDLIVPYSIKSYDTIYYFLKFLAKQKEIESIRKMHKNFNLINKINLNSFNDYIKYSLNSNIIKQVFEYDFKKQKAINTKSQFYFTNSNYRNSLVNYSLYNSLINKNIIFNQLQYNNYQVFSGKNGTFEFDFFAIQNINNNYSSNKKNTTNIIFIDFCNTTDKQEFKKQINKLLKVPQIPLTTKNKTNSTQIFHKFLIVNNYKKLQIRKTQYENLKIIEFNEFVKNFK